ncbi:hypothetical protein M8J76_014430 [Diaphorina citri]|nr:hypothetical protein M8J75_008591 [Diaphorina citri]KAI5719767.1 hypothetical protein M8J76_014430 [Diaphorina citri]KAI5720928.1 hypothetical protein M8J77_013315 [Diaphorina citri]
MRKSPTTSCLVGLTATLYISTSLVYCVHWLRFPDPWDVDLIHRGRGVVTRVCGLDQISDDATSTRSNVASYEANAVKEESSQLSLRQYSPRDNNLIQMTTDAFPMKHSYKILSGMSHKDRVTFYKTECPALAQGICHINILQVISREKFST